MASITIDGKDYDLDDLSDKAKEQVASIQFVQEELKKLEAQINVYRTASAAYSMALKNELNQDI